jgi:hypothetical protein
MKYIKYKNKYINQSEKIQHGSGKMTLNEYNDTFYELFTNNEKTTKYTTIEINDYLNITRGAFACESGYLFNLLIINELNIDFSDDNLKQIFNDNEHNILKIAPKILRLNRDFEIKTRHNSLNNFNNTNLIGVFIGMLFLYKYVLTMGVTSDTEKVCNIEQDKLTTYNQFNDIKFYQLFDINKDKNIQEYDNIFQFIKKATLDVILNYLQEYKTTITKIHFKDIDIFESDNLESDNLEKITKKEKRKIKETLDKNKDVYSKFKLFIYQFNKFPISKINIEIFYIILCFLWLISGNLDDGAILNEYHKGIQDVFNKFNNIIDSYDQSKQYKINFNTFKHTYSTKKPVKFEDYILMLQLNKLFKLHTYKLITIPAVGNFYNCVETTILNLVNIINIKKINDNIIFVPNEELGPHPKLKEYYEKFYTYDLQQSQNKLTIFDMQMDGLTAWAVTIHKILTDEITYTDEQQKNLFNPSNNYELKIGVIDIEFKKKPIILYILHKLYNNIQTLEDFNKSSNIIKIDTKNYNNKHGTGDITINTKYGNFLIKENLYHSSIEEIDDMGNETNDKTLYREINKYIMSSELNEFNKNRK